MSPYRPEKHDVSNINTSFSSHPHSFDLTFPRPTLIVAKAVHMYPQEAFCHAADREGVHVPLATVHVKDVCAGGRPPPDQETGRGQELREAEV